MDIKGPGVEIKDMPNGTVMMKSGDHLTVGYIDPQGRFNSFVISAQHLVFLATHSESEATMLIRPATGLHNSCRVSNESVHSA